MPQITRDEWLKALEQAQSVDKTDRNPDALTIKELADLLDCSRSKIERFLPRLMASGLVEEVKKFTRRGHSVYPVAAYRLKESSERRATRR